MWRLTSKTRCFQKCPLKGPRPRQSLQKADGSHTRLWKRQDVAKVSGELSRVAGRANLSDQCRVSEYSRPPQGGSVRGVSLTWNRV